MNNTSPADAENMLILVVDDLEIIRETVAAYLTRAGYRVSKARDGLEAMRLCQSLDFRVDLVITDIDMPVLDGVELGRLLLAERPDMKILYMSAYPRPERLLAHCAQFMAKPYTISTLLSTIRNLLVMA